MLVSLPARDEHTASSAMKFLLCFTVLLLLALTSVRCDISPEAKAAFKKMAEKVCAAPPDKQEQVEKKCSIMTEELVSR